MPHGAERNRNSATYLPDSGSIWVLFFRPLVQSSLTRHGFIVTFFCPLIARPIFERARKQRIDAGRIVGVCTASLNKPANFITKISRYTLGRAARGTLAAESQEYFQVIPIHVTLPLECAAGIQP